MTNPQNSSPEFGQLEAANAYVGFGFNLVPIPYGVKGPSRAGWNAKENLVKDHDEALRAFGGQPLNMGIQHQASGTCAIDIDDVEKTRMVFDHFGLDYDGMVSKGLRIYSKPNRDKLIFRAPDGLSLEQIRWPKEVQTRPNDVFTIFELRAGPNQDVLPPSKHPDGHFYRWQDGRAPWDFGADALPDLPADVLEFWMAYSNSDGVKAAVQMVCPWKKADEKIFRPRPGSSGSDRHDIIGKFNAANDIGEMLEGCGYKRKGKRYLAPSSSTGEAGVNILDDGTHCYSHHGSDVLADGYAHDSFDVLVLCRNNGNFNAALSEAARELGIDRDAPTEGAMSDDEIDGMLAASNARKAAAAGAPDSQHCDDDVEEETANPPGAGDPNYPEHLKNPPGMVGEIAKWILSTASMPLPMSSVACALSIVGTALARQVCGPTSGRTNMYFATLARSGFGKDHPRKCVKELFTKALLMDELLNGEEMISAAGFRTATAARPRGLFLVDELGRLLESISHKNVGSHMLDLTTSIMKMFSSSDSIYLGGDKADSKLHPRVPIPFPCVGIYATTVPRSFYENLNSDSISSGFLNRFMVVEESSIRPKDGYMGPRTAPPEALVWWIKATQKINQHSVNDANSDPGEFPARVEFDGNAPEVLSQDFRRWCYSRGDSYTGTSKEPMQELWVRCYEYAMKIALVLGVGMTWDAAELANAKDRHTLKIDTECMQWGIDFAKAMTEHVEKAASTRMGDTEHAKLALKVLGVLRAAGERGRTEAELSKFCAAYSGSNKTARDGVIETLKRDGQMRMGQRVGKNGKSFVTFVATGKGE